MKNIFEKLQKIMNQFILLPFKLNKNFRKYVNLSRLSVSAFWKIQHDLLNIEINCRKKDFFSEGTKYEYNGQY